MINQKNVLAVGQLVDDPHSSAGEPGAVSFTLRTAAERLPDDGDREGRLSILYRVEVRDVLSKSVSRDLGAGTVVFIEGVAIDHQFSVLGSSQALVTKVRLDAFQVLAPWDGETD